MKNTDLIVALDVDSLAEALRIVDACGPAATWFKVGKQLFTREGPDIVQALDRRGKRVFLDLKFHDIPNTVAQAVRAAAATGAAMTNVHASGGPDMLAAAVEAARESRVLLLAVTVLTSMDDAALNAAGVEGTARDQVLRLAELARRQAVDGLVCSALEIAPLRERFGDAFTFVVPGIRPANAQRGDQKRVMTPAQAARAGADYIVVGRPITQADDPAEAAAQVRAELETA